MFDFARPYERDRTFIFTTPAGTTNPPQQWRKPSGIQMVHILLIGAGGPGGNGATGATGTARGGGGGGGGGGIVTALFPAHVLPDIFYVKCGTFVAAGSDGGPTQIMLYPSSFYPLLSAVGGAAGGNAAGTTAGVAAPVTTATATTGFAVGSFCIINSYGGCAGNPGGSGTATAPSNLALPSTTGIVTGGVGGAGITTLNAGNAGGTILGTSDIAISQINGGAANANNPGADGIFSFKPLFSLGGAGGASNNGTAGNGGTGGHGSGGGGGGGGITGGTGGRGGNGIAIITCW